MRKVAALLLGASVLATGCHKVNVLTEIEPDGNWVRRVEFTMNAQPEGLNPQLPKLDEMFAIPKPDATLTVVNSKNEGSTSITLTRSLARTQILNNDVALFLEGKRQLANSVAINTLADGQFEYVETLTWTGPKDSDRIDPQIRARVKKALGPAAKTTEIDQTTKEMMVAVWRLVFGPAEPMLPTVLFHPDLALAKLRAGVTREMDRVLRARGIADSPRRQFLNEIVRDLDTNDVFNTQERAKEPENASNTVLVPYLFRVKVPGTIVSTNGQVDPVSNEIFWALYPESAMPGDVVLRVVYKP